jgi:hypothetical protein
MAVAQIENRFFCHANKGSCPGGVAWLAFLPMAAVTFNVPLSVYVV